MSRDLISNAISGKSLNSNKDWVSNYMPFASDPDNVDISTVRADGDANVEDKDLNTFQVPGCSTERCCHASCRFLRRFDRETRQG